MDPNMIALLALPFAGAILCAVLRREAKIVAGAVAAWTMALALGAVVGTYPGTWEGRFGSLPWLSGTGAGIQGIFGVRLDPLSSLMLLLVSVLGLAVTLFSREYLSGKNAEHP